MKFIQCPVTHKLIPRDEYVRPKEASHAVWNDLPSFVSPVDGSVISDRKQLREHNVRNNVVSADNFSPEFQKRKEDERHNAEHGKKAVRERRQAMYEVMVRAERGIPEYRPHRQEEDYE
jgi:hypothetical protein